MVFSHPSEKSCSSNWKSSPIFGVKIKNVWNHHLDVYCKVLIVSFSTIIITIKLWKKNQSVITFFSENPTNHLRDRWLKSHHLRLKKHVAARCLLITRCPFTDSNLHGGRGAFGHGSTCKQRNELILLAFMGWTGWFGRKISCSWKVILVIWWISKNIPWMTCWNLFSTQWWFRAWWFQSPH